MMTIPSIDAVLPSVEGALETPVTAMPAVSPEVVARFQSAMQRPIAENAHLQHVLESLVDGCDGFTVPECPGAVRPEAEAPTTRQDWRVPFAEADVPRASVPEAEVSHVVVASPDARPVPTAETDVPRVPAAGPDPVAIAVESGDVLVADAQATKTFAREVSPGEDHVVTQETVRSEDEEAAAPRAAMPPKQAVRSDRMLRSDRSAESEGDVSSPAALPAMPTGSADPMAMPSVVEAPVATARIDAAVRTTPVTPTETFVQAAEAVAETILVSPGLLKGQGEIRVQLKADVLDGSEIRISVSERQMQVDFTPTTPEVAALIEQCRPQLEQHLAARIHSYQIAVGLTGRRTRQSERV